MNWGLPTSVEIGGESYEIRTDFRVIRYAQIFA